MTLAVNKSERQTMIAANVGGQGMGRFKQRQAEVITYEIDYSGWLADAETITAATYEIAPTTDPAAVIVGSTISGGNTLLFQIDNGAEGTRYIVNVTITTSTSQTKVDFFSVTIGTFSNESAQVDVATASSTAVAARNQAVAAATSAQTSATNAAASAASSLSGATTTTTKASEAATSAGNAATSASNAASSASAAATSANNAASSATIATTKATEASQFASSASGAASLADQRATAAATSQSSAATSASTATTKASEAATSATTAATKASEASASATSASTSASTATTKASEAAASATSASTSASTATTKASEAAASATAAATSASNAATSATTATTKAGEASTSATNAATSATNAATSTTSAATSATTATTKAGEASTSASNAATSATTATTKASEAATSATNAATSATTATTKASEAAASATSAWNAASGIQGVAPYVVTLTDAPYISLNALTGTVFQVTLGGNRILDLPTNLVPGRQYFLRVQQDATGSRTLAYDPIFRFQNDTAPTLTTTPFAIDVISFVYDGVNIYGEVVALNYLAGPVAYSNFARPRLDYTTLSTLSSMPTGGSISRAGQAMLYDSTGKLTYAPNNLLTRSQEFDNATWAKVRASVSANLDTAPDGTTTADKIVEDSSLNTHYLGTNGSLTLPANTNFIYSIYLKKAERTTAIITRSGAGITTGVTTANLNAGTVSSTGTAVISNAGNGWYRVSVLVVVGSADTTDFPYIYINTNSSYQGDGASGLYAWGAQLEAVTYATTPSSYVATTSAAFYGARFDTDPATLQSKGLLVEGTRTNLQTYSEQLDNAAWTPSVITVTPNATTAPDGSSNADAIIPTTTSGGHALLGIGTLAASTVYSVSVYAKAAGYNYLAINVSGTAANGVSFNLSNGSYVAGASVLSASMTSVGNGWYRCVIVTSAGVTWQPRYYVNTTASTGADVYAGNGTSGIYLWGAQTEAASFPSSYIPTGASSVARAAETFTLANYANRLVEAFWIDQQTGVANSFPETVVSSGSVTISPPTFGWVTSLRAYTNAYAGDIAVPSWIDGSGTTGNRMVTDSTGTLTWAPANIILYSQDYTNASWVKRASTVASGFTAPDGTSTAIKIAEDNTNSSHDVYQSLSFPAGVNFVWSVYAKAGERNWMWIDASDGVSARSWINLTDGTTGTIASGVTLTVQSVGSGWYRISAFKPSAGGSGYFNFGLATGNNSAVYVGTVGSGAYFWGAQLERVTYQQQPRAYLPSTTAAVYQPRFDYSPSTGQPLGMLIEESRINLALQSQNFATTWGVSNIATPVVANINDPAGALSAYVISNTAASGVHGIQQTITVSASTNYAFSVYLKQGTIRYVSVIIAAAASGNGGYAVFDLQSGGVTQSGASSSGGTLVSTSISSVGNGWYRCAIVASQNTTSVFAMLAPVLSGTPVVDAYGRQNYAGATTDNFYAFGAQLEAGAFATSYIPTVAAAVTRVADSVYISGSSFSSIWNASKGSIVSQVVPSVVGARGVFSVNNGTVNNRMDARINGAAVVSDGGVGQATIGIPSFTNYTVGRVAFAYEVNNFAAVANGGTVGTDTLGTVPTVNRFQFGGFDANPAYNLCGHVQSFAYYNQRLPDATLKSKSTVGAPL